MGMRHFLAAGVALGILAGAASPGLAASPPNMLVIGTDLAAIPSLDPAAINARTVSEVVSNLYDNLVQFAPNDMQTVRPMLAESWTVAADKRSISFTMRKGALFASGNPVTAEDAAWSIRRVIKMAQVGSTDIALWGYTPENVDRLVRAADERTLVVELPEPVAVELVLQSLAGSSLGVIDSKVALKNEKNGDLARDWLKANAAPSGAFTLSQWRPNDILICEARANYWGGAPAMKRVIMRHIPESGSQRLQLMAGDIDVAQYLGSGDLEAIAKEKVVIDQVPGFGFYYIALNTKDPDLAKPLVRRAFQHVLDWKSLAQSNMRYAGFPWQSIIPKGMPGEPANPTPGYAFDPALAKKLLAEAGYPNGLKKKLFPAGPVHLQNTEALQASAKLAGIDLELVPGEHTPDFRARNFEVLMGNSGARLPDPFGTAVQYAYNPDNRDSAKLGGYYLWRTALDAPELTRMVDQSKSETDPAKRKALFEAMDRIYREMDPPLIVFFQRTDPYVFRTNVKGYFGHQTWSTRWNGVTKE